VLKDIKKVLIELYDLIIKNGVVLNGTGNPWFKADLAISDGKIARIGKLSSESAYKSIDAANLFVAPGFIDIHSHADFTLLLNPKAESLVRQGVTTTVIGNCGHTPYPVEEGRKEDLKRIITGYQEMEIDWVSLDGYLKRLEKQGVAINVVPLVGHGSIRVATMGFDARLPTKDELEKMKKWVRRSLDEGAFGLSTGLEYPPGFYSNTEEIVELCKVVAEYGRLYVTHIRNRGEGIIAATEEAIKIGELTGVPVHISHHVPRYPSENMADKVLELIDKARAKGADVSCDALVPFVREDTSLQEYMFAPGPLPAMLPEWAFEGGIEKLQERLRDKRMREEMRMKNTKAQARLAIDGQWHRIFIASCASHPEYVGKNIKEIAEKEGKDPWDVVFDLLLDEGKNCYNVLTTSAAYTVEDGIKVLKHPTASPGSDALALAPYGPLSKISMGLGSYGFIPYFFEKYVRERKIMSLEEAVRKCTSLPAQRFGIKDRGLLCEGMWADIVIFDPDRVKCKATFAQPDQYPEGIEYVIVNGEIVIEKGQHTGALPGKPLRATM